MAFIGSAFAYKLSYFPPREPSHGRGVLGVFLEITMKEIWKDIPGYEGLYQVSNLGRVKSLDRIEDGVGRGFPRKKRGRILKQPKTGTGYYFVTLAVNRRHKLERVHRIVASTFIPNPLNLGDVNHKDGNKLNNNVDNLEWCTRQENIRHAFRTGLSKPHHNQINKKGVEIYDFSGFSKTFSSIAEAASFLGVSQSGVSRACSGKLKHSGGYMCRFIQQ